MHKPQFSKKNKNKIAYLGACSKSKNYVPKMPPPPYPQTLIFGMISKLPSNSKVLWKKKEKRKKSQKLLPKSK
jgi:hypothetical protein